MAFWMDIYFMNAATPVMEQMIFFHDHSMVVIFTILVFLFFMMFNLMNLKIFNLSLMENQLVESVWTFLPMFLLLLIVVPSLRLLYLMEEMYSPDMTIKVMAHQWYWSYEYPEFNLNFDSFMLKESSLLNFRLLDTDAYLIFPVSVMIRFLISSADVIHSFSVQSLGIKADAVPGRLNQVNVFMTRPGLYFGQCSEICGMNHSFMPISMKVVSTDYFLKNLVKKV